MGASRRGWRLLGAFWLLVVFAAGAGAGILQMLGTPSSAPRAHVEAAPAARADSLPGTPLRPGWVGWITPPDPALQEPAPNFSPSTLPRIAPDGRMAMQVYARPADRGDPRPKIAILLSGFGLAEAESRAAIALPGPVDLAVSVYARQIDPLLDAARTAGHELLESIPMEPQGFPLNDAGYASLLVSAPPGANVRNLERALAHVPGAVGATGASDGFRGERFISNTDAFAFVPAELARRGLLYVDPRPGAALPAGVAGRSVDVVIDDPPARAEIEGKLNTLERLARAQGSALGLAGPIRQATLERLGVWLQGLESRGIALVPVSALARAATAAP